MPSELSTNLEKTGSSMPAQASVQHQEKKSIWQKVHESIGFQKGYNFPLFVILAGAMFGFGLARLFYLNIGGTASSSYASGSIPGDWYWYHQGFYRIGITLHLATVIPAGLLMVWQFVPIIRHKFLLFHRINGYLVILLALAGNVGALMICRRAFGGTVDTQAAVDTLAILVTASIAMAYYNIKRLQIDQHRAWMLRAMVYMGAIITVRLIMIIAAQITTLMKDNSAIMTCEEIAFIHKVAVDTISNYYPACQNSTTAQAVVTADFDSNRAEQIGASFDINFGMAFWLAIVLHLVGVEIYLGLTPREGNRLRQVSYERQLERGSEHPGSAGLTSDRWGDAEKWQPSVLA